MSATETADEIARLNRECEALIPRIAELEAECREWKEQCEKGDAKLVRECEEWRELCREGAPQEKWAEDSNTDARITELEAALFACAEAAGEDVSDGAPTWPDITTWAVRAVKELRKDYGDACAELHPELTGTAARGEAPHKQCSGCEGSPSGDNDPCGVCQTESVSPIEKAADVLAEAVDRMPQKTMAVHDALFSYLKVKEGK